MDDGRLVTPTGAHSLQWSLQPTGAVGMEIGFKKKTAERQAPRETEQSPWCIWFSGRTGEALRRLKRVSGPSSLCLPSEWV